MPIIQSLSKIAFTMPTDVLDIVAIRVYVASQPDITLQTPTFVRVPVEALDVLPEDELPATHAVDLNDVVLPPVEGGNEIAFMAIAAVDDANNVGDLGEVLTVPLDQTPPPVLENVRLIP